MGCNGARTTFYMKFMHESPGMLEPMVRQPHFLLDPLTLIQPVGAYYAHYYWHPNPFTFLHPVKLYLNDEKTLVGFWPHI